LETRLGAGSASPTHIAEQKDQSGGVAGEAAARFVRDGPQGENVIASGAVAGASLDESPPASFDQSTEAEFLLAARERGETIVPSARTAVADDEPGPQPLPPLEEMVERIPREIRETLDELFRVKFVRVQRVPRDALNK
jgi:hypothetical protein